MPFIPCPSSAAAISPPIQDPCPFQSVVGGPPNWAARSASDFPKNVLQRGGLSPFVKSTTALTLGASSECVKSRPVSATPTVTAELPAAASDVPGSTATSIAAAGSSTATRTLQRRMLISQPPGVIPRAAGAAALCSGGSNHNSSHTSDRHLDVPLVTRAAQAGGGEGG